MASHRSMQPAGQSSPRGSQFYDGQQSPRGSQFYDGQQSPRGSQFYDGQQSPRGSQYGSITAPTDIQYGSHHSPRGSQYGSPASPTDVQYGSHNSPRGSQYGNQPSPQGSQYGSHSLPRGTEPVSQHSPHHVRRTHSGQIPQQQVHPYHTKSQSLPRHSGSQSQSIPASWETQPRGQQPTRDSQYSSQSLRSSQGSQYSQHPEFTARENPPDQKRRSRSSSKGSTNGYARSPEKEDPPMVMEASQISEILRKRIAHLSGGRDRRGGPVLTLPTHNLAIEFPPQDIIACLSYLASVPSEESAAKGFTLIVDNREGYWRNLRTLFRAIHQSLGGRIHAVHVLRPDQILDRQRLNLSFRKDKTQLSFEPQFITLQRLQNYVHSAQLSEELGGTLPYNHDTWLSNRLALERFLREARSVSKHLDTAMAQLTQRLRREETTSPQDLLRQHRYLQETVLQTPENVIRQGRDLYTQFQSDRDTGFRVDDSTLTLDQVVAMNQIKRAVETLENRLDKIQNFWQERDRELSQTVQYSDLEATMKTVIDWIVGPAEKLLSSQTDIGDSYKAAEELRKQHEQLELKCTDTYGTYAELRHKVEELVKEGHEKAGDVEAQRDYMDTVCRSYAARLERRRNLIITSVRFHRLAEELSRRLDDLLELLCTDIVAEDVESVEKALRTLQEKCDTITVAAEQTESEGQSLLDQLSLPVKNALGKDVSPDNKGHMTHVQKLLDELQERKKRADELADVRKLKLQQILQLRTCERDADQAINWIIELCDVMSASQMELGRSPTEAEQLQVDHQKFETTAKGTYEYGKQLLQAALVLRRSLRYDLEPNNLQAQRLANAWKKFSQGINERAIRLNNVFIFNKNADALLENIEEMILVISRCVNLEITVEDLVIGYESSRDHMKIQYDETIKLGQHLLERLAMPVLTLEGDEKHLTLDDEGTSEVIKGKMKLLKLKMTNLKRYWDEQTQGLILGPNGELLGPDGRVIRPAPTKEELAERKAPKVKHTKHTIDIANITSEITPIYDSRDERMRDMRGEVSETLQSRKSLWDDIMEQPISKPEVRAYKKSATDTPSPGRSSADTSNDSIHPQHVAPLQYAGSQELAPLQYEGSQELAPLQYEGSQQGAPLQLERAFQGAPLSQGQWEQEWRQVEAKLRESELK